MIRGRREGAQREKERERKREIMLDGRLRLRVSNQLDMEDIVYNGVQVEERDVLVVVVEER